MEAREKLILCRITKRGSERIVWVPARLAKVGKKIALVTQHCIHEGWMIVRVYRQARTVNDQEGNRCWRKVA